MPNLTSLNFSMNSYCPTATNDVDVFICVIDIYTTKFVNNNFCHNFACRLSA